MRALYSLYEHTSKKMTHAPRTPSFKTVSIACIYSRQAFLALLDWREEVETKLRTVFAEVECDRVVLGFAQLAQFGHIVTSETRDVALALSVGRPDA